MSRSVARLARLGGLGVAAKILDHVSPSIDALQPCDSNGGNLLQLLAPVVYLGEVLAFFEHLFRRLADLFQENRKPLGIIVILLTPLPILFLSLGVEKIRLTGGEPLARRDLALLVDRKSVV